IVLIAVLFFGLGEELWSSFMPLYLRALSKEQLHEGVAIGWATLWTVGLYACLRNIFEGFCYIGGGQLTARLGRSEFVAPLSLINHQRICAVFGGGGALGGHPGRASDPRLGAALRAGHLHDGRHHGGFRAAWHGLRRAVDPKKATESHWPILSRMGFVFR